MPHFKCVFALHFLQLYLNDQGGIKLSAEALHGLMSCILYRFHKRTEASFYDHVLQRLESSRTDIFTLCALGTTENGLVTCEVSVSRKHVIHVMPALGPSLEDCPPKQSR